MGDPNCDIFIVSIRKALISLEHVSNDAAVEAMGAIDKALEILREKHEEFRLIEMKSRLRYKGPCLNCKKEIEYAYPSTTHQGIGDDWLDALFSKWVYPPVLSYDLGKLKINGYRPVTTSPYICEDCSNRIKEFIEHDEQSKRQRREELRRSAKVDDWQAVILGEKKVTPAKRYQTFLAHYDNAVEKDRLLKLPYKEFLQTLYWVIIRNYVVYKGGYRCELCSSNENLNVHHKTYEHHGEEHLYIDDLIVLCHNCHTKFHGKDQ